MKECVQTFDWFFKAEQNNSHDLNHMHLLKPYEYLLLVLLANKTLRSDST